MELSLRRTITEKWQVSNCSKCGAEPELLEWVDSRNHQCRNIVIRCSECQRQARGQTYIYYNKDALSHENDRYNAVVLAIRNWENLD